MNSEKVRLLKFLNVFAIGGTERQFVNIVQRLDLNQFDLHLACFQKGGPFLQEVEACGRPLTAFRIKGMANYRTLITQLQFARYLKRHRIQVLHTYGWYANVFGLPAAKLAGVPVTIASIRDTGAHLTVAQRKVQRTVCRLAKCVLANSEAVKDWLVTEGFRPGNLQVIRNGIIRNNGSQRPAVNIRQEFGFPEEAPLIGTVCRLNSVKAVNDFIDAAALILPHYPSARFLVVGDGELRSALMAQAAGLGIGDRVVFTGFRTDTAQLLPQLTVSVLSSLTEGLSNTLLESMAASVPVVATRVGGNSEIIAEGINGFLVPASSPGDLANRIGRLLSNPQLGIEMGAAGRERVDRHFSMERAVHQTEELYRNLLTQCRVAL